MIHAGSIKREIKAQISISRSYGGGEDSRISIQVEDRSSCIAVVSLELSLEQFAMAVTGQSVNVEKGVVYMNQNIGMKHECEEISVPMERDAWSGKDWNEFKDYAKAYCEGLKPGWVMDEIGDRNSHRVSYPKKGEEGTYYRVIVRRWV